MENLEYEKIVLNSILIYPDNFSLVPNEKIFGNKDSRHIYNALKECNEDGVDGNYENVLERIPPTSQVSLLETTTVSKCENIKPYIEPLKDLAIKREIDKVINRTHTLFEEVCSYEAMTKLKEDISSIEKSLGFEDVSNNFGIKKFTEIDEKQPKVLMIDSLPVAENTVSLLTGAGGTGKSLVTIQMGMRYIMETGKKALLWLSEDNQRISQQRAELIASNILGLEGEAKDKVLDKLYITCETPFNVIRKGREGMQTTKEWMMFKQQIKAHEFGFIVLDPLIAYMTSLDENSNTDGKAIMKEFVNFATTDNVTMVIIHHSSKGSATSRGAGSIVDAVRLVYNITRENGQTTTRNVTIQKDNNNLKSFWGTADFVEIQIV